MKIKDRIYGEILVNEPIIEKLINTKAFQRLKGINQYGAVNFIYPDQFQTSRFEHSIGVWYVLNTLGASMEVQVAALLHDVGHTAFSHLVDMAMSDKAEDYHERFSHLIAGMDEVNDILAENGIKLKNVDDYPEIKKSLPDIGADRFDYAIRDSVSAQGNNFVETGRNLLNKVTMLSDGIVFTDADAAEEFGRMGLQAMWDVIYQPKVAVVYQAIIDILRAAFEKGILTDQDILQDDRFVMDKILANEGEFEAKWLDVFRRKFEAEVVSATDDYDLKHLKLKVRYFDPRVKQGDQIKHLSEISDEYREVLADYKQKFEKRVEGEYFKVVFRD